MKKNKKGFTLAEVLITLGIVGIIAALTLPALFHDVNKHVNADGIGRAKELFEHGMANIIQTANKNGAYRIGNDANYGGGVGVSTLAAIQMRDFAVDDQDPRHNDESYIIDDEDSDSNILTRTFALTGIKTFDAADDYKANIKMYEGNNLLSTVFQDIGEYPVYKFDKSDVLIMYRPVTNIPQDGDIPDDRVLTAVIMDMNGEDEPNRVGRDVFVFGLANNGHLIPAGSVAYNKNIMGSAVRLYTVDCTDDNIVNGIACAARLMAEGWKINY